ncbi:MAG TPA: hypothetical protein VMH86_00755 [Rhizomicrobium sp.]|nr:hypothetical protein [Rhizomicrobium sp.]
MRMPILALCTALLAAGAAFAQSTGPATGPATGQAPHGFLTPEQRAMLRTEQPGAGDWRNMTGAQRQQFRDQLRAKWQAMSEADKQALRARLQAAWDALPAAQKQALEQKIAERRARWQQQGSGQ